MMYGHVETLEERVEHMRRVRELQDETGGFRPSSPGRSSPTATGWPTCRDEDMPGRSSTCGRRPSRGSTSTTSPNIQSSWVTQGPKIGQVALGFGANDMGSLMIEENVVSSAGTTHRTSTDELVHLIKALGKTPVQRDTLYREVRTF